MAFLHDATFKGLAIKGAYHKVSAVSVSKTVMDVTVEKRVSKEAESFDVIVDKVLPYDLAGPNPFEQAYSELKKLPEFADAVDC